MRDEEATEYFEKLAAILQRHNLAWVIAEVRDTLRLGKLRTKALRVETELWADGADDSVLSPPPRKRSVERFTVSEPYTPREALQILLVAICSLTTDLAAIERRIGTLIERSGRRASAPEIALHPTINLYDENSDKIAWKSGPQVRDSLAKLAVKMSPLLERLKRELNAD